uniref:Uncharacterized protein n=1 Tax=Pristionchus pacificus TaxID=54126 RepID=A0A2A6C7Q0_PRIPA|eukprot:PDM74126.1 hypothetical protein PRIPAC_41482 [Pristionchus pacificus]
MRPGESMHADIAPLSLSLSSPSDPSLTLSLVVNVSLWALSESRCLYRALLHPTGKRRRRRHRATQKKEG